MPRWPPFESHFWSLVEPEPNTGCWIWIGDVSKQYGRVWYNKKREAAHRVAWALTYGPIPDGLVACHKCDFRLCVNPSHVFLGTQSDNMQDWTKKGKNRLIREKLAPIGDAHWTRKSSSLSWRREHAKRLRDEITSGVRTVLRDSKTGRIMGTTK